MKAEYAVLALIGVSLALGYYASFEGVMYVVTMFTHNTPSVITQLGIALAIPATYLLVFGVGIPLGTVTQVEP